MLALNVPERLPVGVTLITWARGDEVVTTGSLLGSSGRPIRSVQRNRMVSLEPAESKNGTEILLMDWTVEPATPYQYGMRAGAWLLVPAMLMKP